MEGRLFIGASAPVFRENGEFSKVTFPRPVPDWTPERDDATTIIGCIRDNPSITQPRIAQTTGISVSMVKKIMARLGENSTTSRSVSRKSGVWVVNETDDD